MLGDIRKEAISKKNGLNVLASSWSKADVGGVYNNPVALINLSESFKKRIFKRQFSSCFMFGEEKFSNDDSSGSADIPNAKRLESFGVEVASFPKPGDEIMIGNLEGFTKLLKYL